MVYFVLYPGVKLYTDDLFYSLRKRHDHKSDGFEN